MAHSWDGGAGSLRVLVAAAVTLAALDARALVLGEAEVRSALGENLDLRIPLTITKGESIEPSCFTLARERDASVPRLTGARVSLERSAAATYLRVRADTITSEPALVLGIVAACPGLFAEVRRDYSFLIDPRVPAASPRAAGSAALETGGRAEPQPPPAPALFPSIATLIARIGDTLESIANAIFPRNRTAKNSYIQALRDANPPLATLGERDPITVDTPIALPDLRTFARAQPRGETRIAQAPAAPAIEAASTPRARTPSGERKATAPIRERVARPAIERPPRAASEPATTPRGTASTAKPFAAVRSHAISPGFVLKLSSGEMDLSPSRSVDDRMRAQLRDRQLVLDADDQVAAVLALRHSVRQLESRVAELQLKLAGMPSTFPAPKTAEAVAPPPKAPEIVPPPKRAEVVAPAKVAEAAAPPRAAEVIAPPKAVEAAATAPPVPPPPPPVPAESAPITAATPTPDSAAATPALKPAEKPEPDASVAAAPPSPAPKKAAQAAPEFDWLYYGLWALAFMLVAAAILLAVRLAKRRRDEAYEPSYEPLSDEEPAAAPPDDEIVVALEHSPADDAFASEPEFAPEPPRRALDADVDIATRLPDTNTDDLRRRYIEERFPEIGKGAISLDEPASVVKGARLFYEDGAIARAVELLHFAIERHPGEVKAWLALFEIFRLEALKGEFAVLARRFREQHGKSEYWRKVQYFGREIDPGNELYAEKPLNTFETIGPAQAKRLAQETSFDPVAENWLGAPMDFQNEVLANELRKALMASAGIGESDLVPNPMPALRNVEMFSVA